MTARIKFSWLKLLDPSNGQPVTGCDLIVSSSSTCASADIASAAGLLKTNASLTVAPGLRYWQVTAHFPISPDAVSTCRQINVTY